MAVRLGRPLPTGADPAVALLARCATSGLRVPDGAVLLNDGAPPTSCPLDLFPPRALVAIRPAVGAPVPYDDAVALTAALTAAYGVGRDVLVLRAVDAVHSGTARLLAPMDLVQAVEGEASGLLLGTVPEVLGLRVPALRRKLQRPHRGGDDWRTPLPPWGMRLSRLLRGVRRAVGAGGRTVEWADDGRVCWLVQVSTRAGLGD